MTRSPTTRRRRYISHIMKSPRTNPLSLILIDDCHLPFRLIGVDRATKKDVTARITVDAATRRIVSVSVR